MTTPQKSLFQKAQQAFIAWNALETEQRISTLEQWVSALKTNLDVLELNQSTLLADHLFAQARHAWSKQITLFGPTGENNTLSIQGRGVFLVAQDNTGTLTSLIGQLLAALIMGNSVLLATEKKHQNYARRLAASLHKASFPDHLVSLINLSDAQLCFSDALLAGVAFSGKKSIMQEWDNQLAQRPGAIINLVPEMDTNQLSTIGSPDYLISFFTERASSVNTAAIGGNAALLKQGSSHEGSDYTN